MQISYRISKRKKFADVKIGECIFNPLGKVYMRIEDCGVDRKGLCNVVELETGKLTCVDPRVDVTPAEVLAECAVEQEVI